MKIKTILGTLAAGFLAVGQAHAGPVSLQGTTITASYNGAASGMLGLDHAYQPEAGSNVTMLAPDDVEFITSDYLFMFDFSETGLLTVYNNSIDPIPAGDYVLRFDFGATLASAITSFSLLDASGISGLPLMTFEDAHTIALDLSDVQWSGQFGMFTVQLDSLAPGTVPEPGAMSLLLVGAAGALLATRRRKRS